MKEYKASSNDTLTFSIKNDDTLVGTLSYKSWFKFNAEIELVNNSKYLVEPKGFWGTTIEIRQGEKVMLTFKMNWSGEIIIQSHFNGLDDGFIFKHRGIFKESFILTNKEGIELLVMKPDFKWNKMSGEYRITTSENFQTLPDQELLMMTCLHCANYYMAIMMTSTVPGG